jgi:hypothetical protein
VAVPFFRGFDLDFALLPGVCAIFQTLTEKYPKVDFSIDIVHFMFYFTVHAHGSNPLLIDIVNERLTGRS